MNLKTTVKALLHNFGIDIVRHSVDLHRPFPVLPYLVQERVETSKPFFFVQIGANDGILDDPIRDLIIQHRLPGLLVEPLPDVFETLKKNYAHQPQLIFENTAILRDATAVEIFRVQASAPVPHHWHGIASFKRRNLIAQGVPPKYIETTVVPGVSIEQLLARHEIHDVTLLVIDVEGYDCEVIKSAFGCGLLPEIVHYENCWLSPNIRSDCKKLLDAHGYRFIDIGKDTLAIRAVTD